MNHIKDSNYNQGVWDFLYTEETAQPDWDLSFLGEEMSIFVAKWHAPVPPSNELLVPLPPPKDRPEQVIEADLVINLEEGDDADDDLE